MLFLICGFREDFIDSLKGEIWNLRTGIYYHDSDSISRFINRVDNLTRELYYYDRMLDIESVKKNLLGVRVVITDDATVVKSDTGNLFNPYQKKDTAEILNTVNYIQQIQLLAERNGANFLCCAVPRAGCFEEGPSNIQNYTLENYEALTEEMHARNIPTLDFLNVFEKQRMQGETIFFHTDHHWTPTTGLAAYQMICKELHFLYGFQVQDIYTQSKNFNIKTYNNWFLGSNGKKAGLFFTWKGADDFDIITPKFPTRFSESVSGREEVRSGNFEETMLYSERLEKDYYHINNYAAYSGGDYRLQIVQNHLNQEGKTIMIIRDSFACVVTPFLALQVKELHVVDDREGTYPSSESIDVEKYVQELKPDFIIVLKGF